jgi:hypothetical protein
MPRVSQQELDPSLRIFISRYIQSIEELEILLLFDREPHITWSAQQIYDIILSTPASVERWLNELVGHGLLEKAPAVATGYCRCSDPELSSQIAMLAKIYRISPVRVIEAMCKRGYLAGQSLADAFKLKNTDQSS